MDDTNKVTVYSASWCAFCHMAKNYLNGLGVAFKDIDVDSTPGAAQELVQKTGQAGIPVLQIGEATIIGFDKPRIDSALAQYNLVK
ncbi:NrdH-redoxin [Candidatus Saccharibacteria bacterium]|jgi:glutaredoxin 3|nr:NrdH-redoxin [Candidatus Saccharibacteria bacterium]